MVLGSSPVAVTKPYLYLFQNLFYTLFIRFLYSIVFCNRFVSEFFVFNRVFDFSKHSIIFKSRYILKCWSHRVEIFLISLRFCEIFTVMNSVIRIYYWILIKSKFPHACLRLVEIKSFCIVHMAFIYLHCSN